MNEYNDIPELPAPADTIRERLHPGIVTRGRVVIIGLGGIGHWLARAVATFLVGLRQALGPDENITILLCDGDAFKMGNTYRIDVPEFGNKAEVLADDLMDRLDQPGLNIRWLGEYVTDTNVAEIIDEGDCVMLACDNHATRKLVGQYCAEGPLKNLVLISGGNDSVEEGSRGTYGNIQVYVREDGHDITAPLTTFHPEIADPVDQTPDALGCVELAASGAAQLSFVNLAVASAMCNALLRLMMPAEDQRMYDEVALDIYDAVTTPHWLSGPQSTTSQQSTAAP